MCKTNGQQDSNEVGLAQMNDFQKQLLEEHNKRRQQHGIPPLQWDHDIARQTQQWANKMAKEGKLKHSQADQRHSLGENIANNSSKNLLYHTKLFAKNFYDLYDHFVHQPLNLFADVR